MLDNLCDFRYNTEIVNIIEYLYSFLRKGVPKPNFYMEYPVKTRRRILKRSKENGRKEKLTYLCRA